MSIAFWKKCDFQVHSPRDPGWSGPRPVGLGELVPGTNEPASHADVESERAEWAQEFVDQCVNKGLEAVALTDHHEMVMVPYALTEIEKRKRADEDFNLWLFPGMELTANGGRQCLIIFDADLSEEWREKARNKLGIASNDSSKWKSKAESVTQLAYLYPDIGEQLDAFDELRGKYIILPNVSRRGPHTVLTKGGHGDFRRMPYVGAYLDNSQTIDSMNDTDRKRISGENKKWSNREIYPISTSDSRSANYSKLGANNCWIKLAEPTAEAIRQAFLGHHSRIRLEPPELPSLYIKKVVVNDSTILTDTTLDISPEFNAVIGGRGTGKSTFLEYVAFGLGCSCFDIPRDHYPGSQRMKDLVEDSIVSNGGNVEVEIVQDNAVFSIVREPETNYQMQIAFTDGNVQTIRTRQLRRLLPALTFSQGELAEIGKRAQGNTKIAFLLQFVNPNFSIEHESFLNGIEAAKKEVAGALHILEDSWRLEARLQQLQLVKESESQRLKAAEKDLPTLSAAHRQMLMHYKSSIDFERQRLRASEQVNRFLREIQSVASAWRDGPEFSSTLKGEAETVESCYRKFFSTLGTQLDSVHKELSKKNDAITLAELVWCKKLELAELEHNKILENIENHDSSIEQIVELHKSISSISDSISEIQGQLKSLRNPLEVLGNARRSLRKMVLAYRNQTREWANKVEELSGQNMRANITSDGDLSQITEALNFIASDTGSVEQSRICQLDEMLSDCTADEVVDQLTHECLQLLKWRQTEYPNVRTRPNCASLSRIVENTPRIYETVAERLDSARVVAIATASATPAIDLYYLDQNREFSFEKASEGQRAASLLLMLLGQEGGPLIIDQPEGDLDNRIITALTEKLHRAKRKRQLIFASHNANIVVNGSSELVGYLEATHEGQREFTHTGAIDDQKVRSIITTTMEGGEKAFKDRMEKYGY